MSWFRKSKNTVGPGPTIPEGETYGRHSSVARPVGVVTVAEILGGWREPAVEAPRTYADEVGDRTRRLSDLQRAILEDAVDRGVPKEDLPRLVADAMNAGVLPRIVNGVTMRGSGVELLLLDGQVPAEALSVSAGIDDMGGLAEASFQFHVGISGSVRKGDKVYKGFSVRNTGKLPQTDRFAPIDHTMLADIDAHMPPPEPVTPGAQ